MRLYRAVPGCDESEAEHLAPAHWCCVDFENVPGRWVPWCVEHDAMGWGSPSSGCANPAAGTKKCRWHPKGAFIPEVAE